MIPLTNNDLVSSSDFPINKMEKECKKMNDNGGQKNAVELSPYLRLSVQEGIKQVGCIPVFLPPSKEAIEKIYSILIPNKVFQDISKTTKDWGDQFVKSEAGAVWTNYRFGLFDSNRPTHKEKRLIEGMNCKICREFYDWIKLSKSEEFSQMPELGILFDQLMILEKECHSIFIEKVKEIARDFPEIEKIFYSYKGENRLPVTIRLIRYEKTGKFCLPFHYDTSILSLIFPSDDDPLKECLVLGPVSSIGFYPELLRRPIRPEPPDSNMTCSLLITGTLLKHIGIPILPTPHGVLPHERTSRYVITACCHVPYLNTSHFNSVISENDEIPEQFKATNRDFL